jgi:hypothetical protein
MGIAGIVIERSEGVMAPRIKSLQAKTVCDRLPKALPRIELHHGQALWVLTQLGFRGAAGENSFKEYIKSLRKLGTPFARGEVRPGSRNLANYSFYHLMELVLVLTIRVYHVVPDSMRAEIVRHRESLYRHYRRAYAERCTGKGSPIVVTANGHKPVCMRGLFLDLQIDFSGGQLTSFGPPKLLSPFEALQVFTKRDIAARSFLPIKLSLLAESVVAAALQPPLIRRGPRKGGRH